MEYYELPTLILFDNKSDKNEYLGENKIKKVPNWDQTMHQKENHASNSSCTICNNSFSSKSNLKKHEKKFCKSGSIKINSEDQRRVANKNGRFPCRKCNRTFKTLPIVKVHEKKSIGREI